jgi:acid phosphatase family membrane protein YuiD
MLYFLAPFIGWLVSGCTKFAVNYLRYGKEARARIGNGGFPSTHTTIMTTTTILIGWNEGFTSALFGLGVAITYIVIIDATGLRRSVGRHAAALNKLDDEANHRESMGHTKLEVLGGICLGGIVGTLLHIF